jgi:hypothetical protein
MAKKVVISAKAEIHQQLTTQPGFSAAWILRLRGG